MGKIAAAALYAAIFVSCSSQYPLLSTQEEFKARELKEYCAKNGINSPAAVTADSLYTQSVKVPKKDADEKSLLLMELATTYYTLAISQFEVAQSKAEIRRLEQSLVKERDKLDTYQKVLNELESVNH
jgi:hypothetical protein